jgi:flagellar biosynthetic protein FlhB
MTRMTRIPINLQYFSQEKTEKATPKKRQEAREKGQVAKSAEIPSSLIMLFVFLFYFLFGSFYSEMIKDLFRIPLTQYMLMDITTNNVGNMAMMVSTKMALMVFPVFAIAMIIGVFGNYIQFGFLFTTKPLEPKLEKLDPIQGFKRIFSLRALVELVKSLLKMLFVGGVSFWVLWGERDAMVSLSMLSVESALKFIGNLTLKLGLIIAFILLVIALLDYLYQRYDYEKNLRMSKQDIKDEFKKTEGDPLIKGKIKERQRQIAMRRMMSEVPKADVVITNPTHFAVALRYDTTTMSAPTVIAKGKDYVALKIKEAAKVHGIMMMENRPLARALYAQVEMGQPVPEDLYQAVAEVLAYVYRLKGKVK